MSEAVLMADDDGRQRGLTTQATPAARVLEFRCAGRRWALDLRDVAGFSDASRLKPVPGASASIAGLAEWRGRIVTVIEFGRLIAGGSAPVDEDASFLRLARPREHLVLRVRAPVTLSRPAASVEVGRAPSSEALARPCRRDDDALELIDPQAVLRAIEREQQV